MWPEKTPHWLLWRHFEESSGGPAFKHNINCQWGELKPDKSNRKRSWEVSSDTTEVKTQTVSSEKGRSHMRTIPACMYFSSCSRLCSTSAGVSVKIFFGGKAGTTLLPYSFFICWYKTHVVKVRLRHRQAKLVTSLILAALITEIRFFPSHPHVWKADVAFFMARAFELRGAVAEIKEMWVHFSERYIHEMNHRFISGTGLMGS